MLDQDLITELEEELKSESKERRKAALLSLLRVGSGSHVHEDVLNLAQEDPDPEIRYIARKALNQFNLTHRPEFDEARSLIQKLLQNTGEKRKEVYRRVFSTADSFMKIELLRSLIMDPEALEHKEFLTEILRGLIREEKDKSLVPTYIKALGTFGTSAELGLLQKSLQSRNPRIVANAIEALEELGEESAQNMVLPLLTHDDNRVRANAIRLVYKFDPQRARDEIMKISQSEHPWMRASALYCLRTLKIDDAPAIAAEMIDREEDKELFNTLLQLVLNKGDGQCARALVRRISKEKNSRLQSMQEEAFRSLCQNLGLNPEKVRREEEKAALDRELEEKQVEKEQPERPHVPIPKTDSKTAAYKPMVVLIGILGIAFLVLRLGWETGVVKKSYSLDALTQKKTIKAEQQQQFLRAEFLRSKGQYQEAILVYDSVLSVSRNHLPSLRGKGLCLLFLDQLEPARRLLEDVSERKPSDALSRKGLSRIYLLQGESPELIISTLEKSIRLAPQDPILPQTLSAYKESLKK